MKKKSRKTFHCFYRKGRKKNCDAALQRIGLTCRSCKRFIIQWQNKYGDMSSFNLNVCSMYVLVLWCCQSNGLTIYFPLNILTNTARTAKNAVLFLFMFFKCDSKWLIWKFVLLNYYLQAASIKCHDKMLTM